MTPHVAGGSDKYLDLIRLYGGGGATGECAGGSGNCQSDDGASAKKISTRVHQFAFGECLISLELQNRIRCQYSSYLISWLGLIHLREAFVINANHPINAPFLI